MLVYYGVISFLPGQCPEHNDHIDEFTTAL